MKQFVENNLEDFKLIADVVREKVELPVMHPAGWHNSRRNADSCNGRIPDHLRVNFRTYPQRIKDFFSNILRRLQ